MFTNFIDKIVSVLLDSFFVQKIKNGLIATDANIINQIENYTENYVTKIIREYNIKTEGLNVKLSKYLNVYLLHYFYMVIFLKKITTIDQDINKFKNFFSKKFNKDNLTYYNEKTNTEILQYILYGLDVLHKIPNNSYIFRTNEIASRWDALSNLIVNKKQNYRIHNLIKILLILFHHTKNREELFNIFMDKSKKDIKEIEIVVPKQKGLITNSLLESFFNIEDSNVNNRLFEFIHLNMNESIKKLDFIKNLDDLVTSNLIYLISDDFLRYHRDNYKYDVEFANQANEKSKRRINIAVNNTNKVSKLYDNLDKKDIDDILMVINNRIRKSITVNDVDEIKILKRLYDEGKNKIENEYYDEFIKIRNIPYINFNKFKFSGITTKLSRSVKLIRYCSFEHVQSSSISSDTGNAVQMRNSGKNINCNITGFCIPSKKNTQFKLSNIVIHNEINITEIKKILVDSLKNKLTKSHCFIFKQDLSEDFILNIFNSLYNTVTNMIYNSIFYKLQKPTLNNIYYYYHLLDQYSNTYLKINYTPDLYTNYINVIYNKLNIKSNYKFDPTLKKKIKYSSKLIKDSFKNLNKIKPTQCKHHIDWKQLNSINKNSDLYSNLEFEYVKKYVQNIYDGDQIKYIICKSCNELLNVWNYVADGFYDTNNNFITSYSSRYTELTQIEEYVKYSHIIEFISKLLNKLSEFTNLSYHGIKKNKLRDFRIREIIILLKYNYYNIKNQLTDPEKYKNYINTFNIQKTILYPIDVDLIDISTFTKLDSEKDNNDKLDINNLIAILIVDIIFNITDIDIIFLKFDSKFNIISYNKVKDKLFGNCKILINLQTNEIDNILNYNILCYVIFILTSYIFVNKLWYSDNINKSIQTHIEIIHTVIDILNKNMYLTQDRINILNNYFSIKNDILKMNISKIQLIIKTKFLKNLKGGFSSKKLYKDIYINYEKILFDKENIKIIENISTKFDINNISHYTSCLINKPSVYKIKPIQYKRQIISTFTIKSVKLPDIKIDLLYYKLKNKLCQINKYDFCKLNKIEKHNRLVIYKYWKIYQSDLDLQKNILYDKKIKETNNKLNYINSLYTKFTKINLKQYIYNFCKYIKIILYQKYKININIESDQYSLDFVYTLKKRSNTIYININEIVEINNILRSTHDKSIYKYDSKSEKVYYFFTKSNLGFIAYQKYNKEIIEIDSNVYRYYLRYEKSLFSKLKYLGLNIDNINKLDTIQGDILSSKIFDQITLIKRYIRNILKYIFILKNDKTLLTNNNHEYLFLIKFIKEYNIHLINVTTDNYIVFKNWNYLNIIDIKKINNLHDYINKDNFILFYFIHELYSLIELNKNKESEVCYFIFDMINYLIDNDEIKKNNFKQQLAKYFIEIEQITSDKYFRNIIGDDNMNTVNELTKTTEVVEETADEGYDMMDNDNDEDDMMESADN